MTSILLKNVRSEMIQVVLLVKHFLGGDGFQNMFVSQPTFSSLDMKKNGEYNISAWKSKGI